MEQSKLAQTRAWARDELERCAAFWLKNGMDPVHGGIYTCLDREGRLYSTDKSVWMQGRCAWAFSWLCRLYGPREEWLAAAKSCLEFLEAHCVNREAGGRLYFTVTAEGKPLRQRRYCYSEAFYAMANAEYYGVTGDRACLERARRAYELYWALIHGAPDPTGLGPKTIPETRSGHGFGPPIICLNMTEIFLRADPERRALYEGRAAQCAEEALRYHMREDLRCLLETVGPDGEAMLELSEGRVLCPGDYFEGGWFLLEQARRSGDEALRGAVEKLFAWGLETGWDEEYGGLYYFTDCLGKPPESYDHDMKFWWPQFELMICALTLYRDTGKETYLAWFFRALDYCRTHLRDEEYGEYYGYLHRDGTPTLPACKGSTFKGPFHILRMLGKVETLLGEILDGAQGESPEDANTD